MTATRFELHIRQLVLPTATGPAQAAAVCAALEAELTELLSYAPLAGLGDRRIHCATASAPDESDATALGRRIARAVHHALCAGEPGDPR
ncbi:hypothetical protein [Streptomyces collinus]|uniref:hypothetical protein n=1 Tax=Streptomyces collinus TaxID=42684 RepID=UPI0033F686B6